MTDQSGAVRLADYRAYDFEVLHISLDVELDPQATVVRSRIDAQRRPGALSGSELVLDGTALDLLSLKLDGEALTPDRYRLEADRLVIPKVPDRFTLETEVRIDPSANSRKKGLFYHAGKLVTQCEAEGFRAITFFPDRPDVLTTYDVTLRADRTRFPVLLSNGLCEAQGEAGDRHWARWRDPLPKPSYIFAIMAGEFGVLRDHYVTGSGRTVQIGVYAEHGEQERSRFAVDSLKEALAWDEAVFGLEYDLDDYNVVALEGYAGAMENKGLNLFGADGVIADPEITTDEEFLLIKRIIGHECFHNWTGNRVTCRDWFQLSLKEGLTRLRDQLFMEESMPPGVVRIDQVKALRRNQFPEDDGPASHPIQPTQYVEIDNFYTTTIYDKGAEVLRMLRTLAGPEGFLRGVRLFLERHDGEAVTLEALFLAFESALGLDLAQFRKWGAQAGRPRVEAEGRYDAKASRYELTLRQVAPPKPGPGGALHIPVSAGLIGPDGGQLITPQVLELTQAEQVYVFEDIKARPTPSLLRGFSAPVSLKTDLSDADLAHLAAHDTDGFVAWDSAQTLMISQIRILAADWRAGRPMVLPPVIGEMFAGLLRSDRQTDALKALLLAVPDEPVLSEGLARIDLDAHMAARTFMRREIARLNRERLRDLQERHGRTDPRRRDPTTIGARMLGNACLELLAATGEAEDIELCLAQVTDAPSMTDRFEALCILSHLDTPLRRQGAEAFLARHRDQSLVVDKWFKAMALSRAPNAIADIIALEAHPAFDIKNTARAIAYYGSLFRQNRVSFHDPSGLGYEFLADRLLLMDQMGAGRPAYFTAQIEQWSRYDDHRQGLMKAALERVVQTPSISPRLREVVSRALA